MNLETNSKKTPASSSILKYDGVNSRRPFSHARYYSELRQPFSPSCHSFALALQPTSNLPDVLRLCRLFLDDARRRSCSPPTIIRVVALRYTSLSRNCKARGGKMRHTKGRGVSIRRREGRVAERKLDRKKGGKDTESEAMLKEVGRILRKMDGLTIMPWKR